MYMYKSSVITLKQWANTTAQIMASREPKHVGISNEFMPRCNLMVITDLYRIVMHCNDTEMNVGGKACSLGANISWNSAKSLTVTELTLKFSAMMSIRMDWYK
jgi:hypothetical protein